MVVVWHSGKRVGLNQRSCSKSGPVNTWMGGKPSLCVASHLGQLSLSSLQCR